MSEITSQVHPAPLPSEDAPASASAPPVSVKPRLWPGVVLVALQWLLILVPGWVAPATMVQFMAMFWGPVIGGAAIALWWLFASRVRWTDRVLVLLACAAVAGGAYFLYHPSIGGF